MGGQWPGVFSGQGRWSGRGRSIFHGNYMQQCTHLQRIVADSESNNYYPQQLCLRISKSGWCPVALASSPATSREVMAAP